MKRRATIEDVAKAAGVSRQTVSRAINDKDEISPITKERVLAAIAELDYRPNRMAQGMVTQRTRTVGLVVPDITNPFFPEFARGVQDSARSNEYNVVLCNSDSDPDEEMHLLRSLMAQGVDGIITFGNVKDGDLLAFADQFRPLILINRLIEHPNINMVLVDNSLGAELAVAHFVSHNHAHIGMLANDETAFSNIRRQLGFQKAATQHGLSLAAGQIAGGQPTLDGGYQAAMTLLQNQPETTAIFTYNDLMALGALRACRDDGRRVPEDCEIIGFDDIQLAAMVTPSLSSIHVNKYDLGEQAMKRILEMLNQPTAVFNTIHIGVSLRLRESTTNQVTPPAEKVS